MSICQLNGAKAWSLVCLSSLVEHIKLMLASLVEHSSSKWRKRAQKETGESVFGLHRHERIAFLHVLHIVSCLFVFSSLAGHISVEWS